MKERTIFSKDFILVAIGQIISLFGNQILRYALPLYLLQQTGSSVLFGTILACSFVPMILLYPIGGIIADRVNKRNIMVILDFATAILTLVFSLLTGKVDIVLLMAVTMMILCGIQGAYQPAVQASIPALIDDKHMMKGNSAINLINSLANMIGPVIGGILFSVFGLTPILYVSIACFFASAVMEIFIHIPYEKQKSTGNIFVTGFGDLKESFSFMFRKQPVLWKISLTYACVNLLLTSLILIALPVIITQHLGFEAATANRLYGYSQGALAGGSIAGGLLTGVLSKKLSLKSSPTLLMGCSFAILMGGIALQVFHTPMPIYIVLLIGSAMLTMLSTLFQIQILTYLQVVTPNGLIGKVISCFICVAMCTSPLGQLLYGFVFDKIGANVYLPFYIASFIIAVIIIATRGIFHETSVQTEQQPA